MVQHRHYGPRGSGLSPLQVLRDPYVGKGSQDSSEGKKGLDHHCSPGTWREVRPGRRPPAMVGGCGAAPEGEDPLGLQEGPDDSHGSDAGGKPGLLLSW